jgi:hypothetical protein
VPQLTLLGHVLENKRCCGPASRYPPAEFHPASHEFAWKKGRRFHFDLPETGFQAYDVKRNTSCDSSVFLSIVRRVDSFLPLQQALEVPTTFKEGGLRNWRRKFT